MALAPTTAPPNSISQEQHDTLTSSTPASFTDIPPILRWEDEAAVVVQSPTWTSWGGEGSSPRVNGRLYVTEDAVAFLPAAGGPSPGFSLSYPALTLHALTPAGGDMPAHIYCQVDESVATTNGAANGASSVPAGEDEEEFAELAELRIFVSEDKLQALFGALSQCSALHASLLPTGEPSSFFGFGGDDDDDWEEDGAFDDADGDDEGGAGRIPSGTDVDADDAEFEAARGADDGDEEVDAVAAFMAKVDWGTVPPPSGWVDVEPEKQVVFPQAAHPTSCQACKSKDTELAAARKRIAELEARLAAQSSPHGL